VLIALFEFAYHMLFIYPNLPPASQQVFRVSSTFANPSIYAVYLMFYIFCSSALWINSKEKNKIFYLVTLILNFIALILTGTRVIWAAVAAGLFIQFIMLKKYKLVYSMTISCSMLLTLLALDPELIPRFDFLEYHLNQRLHIWRSAILCIKEHPFWGQGMLSFMQLFQTGGGKIYSHAHNIFLTLWADFGLFGMAAFVTTVAIAVIKTIKLQYSKYNTEIAICLAYFSGIIIFGLSDNPFLNLGIGFIFAFNMAVPFMPESNTELEQTMAAKA